MTTWVILIYTVPALPTRKRAFVWRELKKLGAVYLHDGVCALPDRSDTREALFRVRDRVHEYEGQATVVEDARLDQQTVERLLAQAASDRQAEYAAVIEAAEHFLTHLRRETRHREFTERELAALEADLAKLHRWLEQIRARQYIDSNAYEPAQAVLAECAEALGAFLDETFVRADVTA